MDFKNLTIDRIESIIMYDMDTEGEILSLKNSYNSLGSNATLKECMDYINKKHDEQIKNKLINCPNCGAPITDYMCEYCGTIF